MPTWCTVVVLRGLAGCSDGVSPIPAGPPPDGPLLDQLTLSTGALFPAFDPAQAHYAVRLRTLEASVIAFTGATSCPGAQIDLLRDTIDGGEVEVLFNGTPVTWRERDRVTVRVRCAEREGRWSIVAVPDDLPTVAVAIQGEPAPGYFMLGNYSWTRQPPSVGRFHLVVDNVGVPVWYRRSEGPPFDLRATPDGRITHVERDRGGNNTGHLRGPDFDLREEWLPVPLDDGRPVVMDGHEFQVLPDGQVLVLGRAENTLDLSPWGGPDEVMVYDSVVQIFSPEGAKVFEWTTEGVVDLDDFDPSYIALARPSGWEYAHVNSAFVDPDDGHLVISALVPNQVLKVARFETERHAAGELIWRLGGASSDFALVDPDGEAQPAFFGQHCAVPLGKGRLLLFDNAYPWFGYPVGDARGVEYRLDEAAGAATLVGEWSGAYLGASRAGGSVQRLPSGATLVGWGSRGDQPDQPVLTEFQADGRVALHLYLTETQWTYRAYKHTRLADGRWQ